MKNLKQNKLLVALVMTLVFCFGSVGTAAALTTSPGCPAGTPATDTSCQNQQTASGGTDSGGCTTDSSSNSFCASTSGQTIYGCGSNGGGDTGLVKTSIDFGCKGDACVNGNSSYGKDPGYCGSYHNGIIDLMFAVIRILSDGVGIVVIGSIIVGGIRYTTSQGDPNATAMAIARIRTSLIALLIFIFSYAILNYLIPDGFFS